jgi:hypothetical protein
MTKVQIEFALQRPLDETLLVRLADAHGIYGMSRVRLSPGGDSLVVEYDASRLSRAQVETALAGIGLPVVPK